jgi:hypothetical protein
MRRGRAMGGLVLGLLMLAAVLSVTRSQGPSAQGHSAQGHSAQGPSPAGPEKTANFESGDLRGWSSTAGATVSSGAADHSTFGAEIRADKAPGFLEWGTDALKQGRTHASLRAYVQLVSRAGAESVDLITIQNSNLRNNFDFFVTGHTQRFKWDLNNADSDQSAFTVVPGRWYLVEVQCEFDGTSYSAGVRIDGVSQGMITSSGQVPATVRSVWLGTPVAKTHVQRYDDVAVRLGDSWPGYLGRVAG